VTRNSVEEKILERAKKKMVLDHLVIQRMDTSGGRGDAAAASKSGAAIFSRGELAKIVQFGAEELFSSVDDEAKSRSLVDMDIDEILSRADADAPAQLAAAEEASKHDATEAFLGAFKVANFSSAAHDPAEDDEDDEEQAAEEEEVSHTTARSMGGTRLHACDRDRGLTRAPVRSLCVRSTGRALCRLISSPLSNCRRTAALSRSTYRRALVIR
jgi:hypothetical protein